MEENVGRTRQGRASRAHSSARKELAANAPPPKRGCRGRKGPPVRGTHDAEAGGSRSRARPPVPDDDDDFDVDVEEEGYPGGPHDLSLLKDYHNHRAILIWDAQADDPILNKSLRCIASANKVIKFEKPEPEVAWFWEMVRATGLEPLIKTNFNGKFLNHRKISRPDAAQMLSSFLGIGERDALDMFATLNGPHLKHSYMRGLVTHNKTSYYLDVVYLQYFQDLSSVHEWNWGSAALVQLQNYMDYASDAGSSQMVGYMSLFEGWIITHFPTLSMWQLETNFTDDMPLNAKFAPGQGHKDSRGYRQSLDNIQVSDIVFIPYDNRRHVRPLIDGIPRDPDMSAVPNTNLFEINRVFAEEVDLRMIDENMRGQHVVNAWDCEPGYISWLYIVSHPKMRPLEAPEEQPRQPELEVLIEESQERRDSNPPELGHLMLVRLRKELQFMVLCVGFSTCLTRV
ncbi:hypothetical protein TSUD_298920 [Trifolium subterraneum]|nr:hypothetical protein TSUD_298920 [Trifolium subterraneum]